jgi:peptidoglycan hydrolase CwlO-like protein
MADKNDYSRLYGAITVNDEKVLKYFLEMGIDPRFFKIPKLMVENPVKLETTMKEVLLQPTESCKETVTKSVDDIETAIEDLHMQPSESTEKSVDDIEVAIKDLQMKPIEPTEKSIDDLEAALKTGLNI